MLNLERLATFVTFADHLNFTHAARHLGLSQPAVHGQVARLAEELGTPLYQRDGRRLTLTRKGQQVAAFGRELQGRVDDFLSDLHGFPQPAITMAAGEGSLLYLLGPGIRHFVARGLAPLRLMTTDREATLEAVRSGQAELGVCALDVLPDDLEAFHLTRVKLALLLPEDDPLAAETHLTLEALSGTRLIVPAADKPHRQRLAAAFAAAEVEWELAVEANGWELMRHFAQLGLGYAVVNAFCPPPPGCVSRPILGLPGQRYVVLHRMGSPIRPAAHALRDSLRATANSWRHPAGP